MHGADLGASASTALTLDVICDAERWHETGAEWSVFVAGLHGLTPFQTPEWLFTWWDHFGSGDLRVFIFRTDQGRLVALIPCFTHEWQDRRQVTLLGSGISDYLEPAIAPEYREEVVACLRVYLACERDWDYCDWQDLSSDTPLARMDSDSDFYTKLIPDLPCSEIVLEGSFTDYWGGRPSGLKRNIRRSRDRALAITQPEIAIMNTGDDEYLDALIRLHSARWREQGEPGMIAANHSAKFLRQIAAKFAAKEMLLLFSLRFEGEITAIIMAFSYGDVLFGYLSAFDPAYAEFGFGRALLYEAISYAFEHEYKSWNFLRGSEPYKSDWGARQISKLRLTIERR